jgi:alpha-galactosidase
LQHSGGGEVFDEYLELVGRENHARTQREPPFGWCSWYHYFNRITDTDITQNTEAAARHIDELPLKLIQLDDGFESDVGDWTERNPRFPRDMRAVAEGIRAQGFIPGLWLAPLIAKPSARIVRSKPGWWLRGRGRWPASAGLVWFRWGRGLDTTQPEAIEHAASLIRTAAHEWGFPYLKLDFLYASALDAPRADRSVTRAQALRRALEAMRAAAGEDTFLLGCGCPLGSGVGIFDAMRVGPDVDFRWHPTFRPISAWIHTDPTFPSARNSIRNTLARAMLHRRWWWNDPDCLLARDTHTQLSLEERRCLATAIALSGGALLVSDDLSHFSAESLRLVQALLPPNGEAARVIGWDDARVPQTAVLPCRGALGEWFVVAQFNLSDAAVQAALDLGALGLPEHAEAFSFWDEQHIPAVARILPLGTIPAHGVRLVAVRGVSDEPALVGSSLHFTQGREVTAFNVSPHGLALAVELGRKGSGHLYLRLPGTPRSATLNGLPAAGQPYDHGLFRLDVAITGSGRLEVTW